MYSGAHDMPRAEIHKTHPSVRGFSNMLNQELKWVSTDFSKKVKVVFPILLLIQLFDNVIQRLHSIVKIDNPVCRFPVLLCHEFCTAFGFLHLKMKLKIPSYKVISCSLKD